MKLRYFLLQGRPYDDKRLFQYRFPEPLWEAIRKWWKRYGPQVNKISIET